MGRDNFTVEIKCTGHMTAPYWKLLETQGNLKTLHNHDYERLKDQILKLGFSEPIACWRYRNKFQILNGHQRLRTIKRMVEKDQYECPELPINLVMAKTWDEAKRKVLSLASQYGRTKAEGLKNFLADSDITIEELMSDYTFADLDLVQWVDEHGPKTVEDDGDLGVDIGEVENPEERESVDIPQGHVRMMSMILEADVCSDFMAQVEKLKAFYETNNVTDTVLKAVREIASENYKIKKSKN